MKTEKNIGLTTRMAEKYRGLFGSNELSQREQKSFWQMYKESFDDICLKVLIAALIVEVAVYVLGNVFPALGIEGDWYSPLFIFAAILVVSFVGTFINYKQDRGVDALRREASLITVKVYRDNQLVEKSINDIVKYDCIFLQAGDKIPADGILIEGSLKVNQAALNGESEDAEKIVLGDNPIPDNDDFFTKLKCFRGSVVTYGSAIMQVTDVGDNTVLGTINTSLNEEDDSKTPSEEKLERLALDIGKFGYWSGGIAAVLHLLLGVFHMASFSVGSIILLLASSIILGVTIVVMAVPEGLPLMNTLVQGLNVGKMLKQHIYVKNPKSIESAGYLTHIFTDKTGTLTEGKMRVVNIITGDSKIYKSWKDICNSIQNALIIGAGVNNEATISADEKAIGSNNTDRTLMEYLAIENKVKIDKSQVKKVDPFDSKVKYSAVTMNDGVKYLKGAPEIVINGCTHFMNSNGEKESFSNASLDKLKSAWDEQTSSAMRVIAIVKDDGTDKIFIAMVSIRDDVRNDVKESVRKLKRAGVNLTMVTGDVLATAKAIAKEAGLVTSSNDVCITHEELSKMSDEHLKEILPNLKVVARAIPSDKERLVQVSRSIGEVVGMTGDGVNDASALHKADVGFAMGSGTEVAKEAGDIIILNDSLTSIADAVMYGRTMSKSVKKFIDFQLTVNVSTVFTTVIGELFGWSEVFTIVQILWINMIMDTLAAIALGQEPARQSYMEEKPVSRNANILNKYLISSIAVSGIFISIICLGILNNWFGVYTMIGSANAEIVRTFMFSTFIMAIIFNSLNARTDSMNLFEHITENKNFILVMLAIAVVQILIIQVGGEVFETVPLSLTNWCAVILISVLIIPIDLIRKVIVRKMGIKE